MQRTRLTLTCIQELTQISSLCLEEQIEVRRKFKNRAKTMKCLSCSFFSSFSFHFLFPESLYFYSFRKQHHFACQICTQAKTLRNCGCLQLGYEQHLIHFFFTPLVMQTVISAWSYTAVYTHREACSHALLSCDLMKCQENGYHFVSSAVTHRF